MRGDDIANLLKQSAFHGVSIASNTEGAPLSGIILVTKKLELDPAGGRQLLCKLNYEVLAELFGARLTLVELEPPAPSRRALPQLSAFRGYIDGVSSDSLSETLRRIRAFDVRKVFIDGSNLGEVARVIKQSAPEVQIATFFHNVEARFFLGALRASKSAHAIGVLVANYLAERKAVRFSDRILAMSSRDSALLQRLYGRTATDIVPMALRDASKPETPISVEAPEERYALFVGGAFYANRNGIRWFVRHVVPHIAVSTYVLGRGLERDRAELERNGRVKVIGEVDSLVPWYQRASFVIAPIFDGSGMKTKVAEALMFGKRVIGSPDAFAGYEAVAKQVGVVCPSADAFVAAIKSEGADAAAPFDPICRAVYEGEYSLEAHKTRLRKILDA